MCFYLCWSILNSCNWLVASGISKILMSSKVRMLKYEIFSPHYPFQCSWWMVNLFWSIRIITCFPVFFFVIWYVLRVSISMKLWKCILYIIDVRFAVFSISMYCCMLYLWFISQKFHSYAASFYLFISHWKF